MYYVRSYHGTQNLGDAIQTVALCRLLPQAAAWAENDPCPGPLIINGWLGRRPFYPPHAVYAGVFVSPDIADHYAAIGASAYRPIGCRDPFTLASLYNRDILDVDLIGCATLTLPRYGGFRSGELRVDDGSREAVTNVIPREMSWPDQWRLACDRLEQLKRASVVHTSRLHVLLPCLAFGTPVAWRAEGPQATARFSLLNAMGIRPGLVDRFDVDTWAVRFRAFLSKALNIAIADREPSMPK